MKTKKTERTIQQIIDAVKAAVMPRGADEHTYGSSTSSPSVIRISPRRFAIVGAVHDVEGYLPGNTNIFFSDAMSAAKNFRLITQEEFDRFFQWSRAERKAQEQKSSRIDLELRAAQLGLRLVKARAPKPPKTKRKR